MYRYHSPLYSRAAAMGVSEAFSSKIICERYIHALSIHAHTRVYTRAWKMHGSVVFITARNALSTEYHFRGTSHHCNEPRFMLKCTRALTRATRTTAPPLTSPRTLPTYLLTYFTGGKSISLSRNLGVDVPLIFRADHRGSGRGQRANFRPVAVFGWRRTIWSTFDGQELDGTSGWRREAK